MCVEGSLLLDFLLSGVWDMNEVTGEWAVILEDGETLRMEVMPTGAMFGVPHPLTERKSNSLNSYKLTVGTL